MTHLRRGVLSGLMLGQARILQHVHESRLAGVIEPLHATTTPSNENGLVPSSAVLSREPTKTSSAQCQMLVGSQTLSKACRLMKSS